MRGTVLGGQRAPHEYLYRFQKVNSLFGLHNFSYSFSLYLKKKIIPFSPISLEGTRYYPRIAPRQAQRGNETATYVVAELGFEPAPA